MYKRQKYLQVLEYYIYMLRKIYGMYVINANVKKLHLYVYSKSIYIQI